MMENKTRPNDSVGRAGKPALPAGRYLKYAIGEIVLVVIGILIALAINNWSQEHVAAKKELLLLRALHDDFIKNQSQFLNVISWHKKALESTDYILSQLPIDPNTLNVDTFNEKSNNWAKRHTFNPTQGVIRSLVNTSSFELISDPELRALLVSWEDVLADYQEEEEMATKVLVEQLLPIILDNFSWKAGLMGDPPNFSFLSSFQFENVFLHRKSNLEDIFGMQTERKEIDQIRFTIEKIIELSKPKV
jgi:hypothetical protein